MDNILVIIYLDLKKSFFFYTKLLISKDGTRVEGAETYWNGWETDSSVDIDIVNKRIKKQANNLCPPPQILIDQIAEDIQGEEAASDRIIFAIIYWL